MCEVTGKFGPGMEEDIRTIEANQCGGNVEEMVVPRAVREKRPLLDLGSPSSTASNVVDATFEPTIDMMVNDFDDEQTLNEEEALAALELQDPHDEIATLKEESEMPIEELMAKYQSLPRPEAPRKKSKKTAKRIKQKQQEEKEASTKVTDPEQNALTETDDVELNVQSDVIVIESGDEEFVGADQKTFEDDEDETDAGTELESTVNLPFDGEAKCAENCMRPVEKARRSHLLDLYPEESFRSVVGGGAEKVVALDMLYADDDEEDDDEAEDEEMDTDYAKKTIMVGGAYQAVIPIGLSQYGDVLPYENEDKLIWEPSQVGEREVEEYLLKAREIKPTLSDDELTDVPMMDVVTKEIPNGKSVDTESDVIGEEQFVKLPLTESKVPSTTSGVEGEGVGVIKDNEQALHLLVQCGYDFKEALRRKRLNAVPLTGSMSLWSEEECHKFEEGIQKFGKDFLKIRQNQVRTRSMRELVQFYYLWKKSDRRDNDFANSDTVDHMDIYLNEGGDYGPNTVAATCVLPGPSTIAPTLPTRKTSACVQKNFSIMTGSNVGSTTSNSQANTAAAAAAKTSFNRRRGTVAASTSLFTSNNNDSQNLSATASCAN